MKEIITLQQAPVIIYDKIQEVSEQVKARIEALDLEKQVVTEQTVKATKSTRTTLRKEFEQLEEARKLIKSKIEEPYKKFEEKYKELIKVHYDEADVTLREKITAFEGQLKEAKATELKEYFDELCAAKGIDFLSFEGLRLNITLSEPVSKLKTTIKGAIDGVANDLELINSVPESDEYKSEVLAEYKKTRNTSGAFKAVNERRDAKAEELRRLEAQKEAAQAQAAEIARTQAAQVQTAPPVLQAPTIVPPTSAPAAQGQAAQAQKKPHRLLFDMLCTDAQANELANIIKQYLKTNNIQIL